MYKMIAVNMAGGKQESSKLMFKGDSAIRALILANDTFIHNKTMDVLICYGMSTHQMKLVDVNLQKRGFIKLVHPDLRKEKKPYRFTCLTAAYIREELKPEQIIYDDNSITKYRYIGFKIGDMEVRALHVPAVDASRWRQQEQISRKKAMLLFEDRLEREETGRKVVVCGDWNTEVGRLECHDIFDALPYEKLLDEATWNSQKLDNVLVSKALKGKVEAYTQSYRQGVTSDHRTVVIDVESIDGM